MLNRIKLFFTQHLALSASEDALEEKLQRAAAYFQFTSLINKAYSPEQKIQLIESLWKIADLLHVAHTDFIMVKNRIGPDKYISRY